MNSTWEQVLIGAVLKDTKLFPDVQDISPDDFSESHNAVIWHEIKMLADRNSLSAVALEHILVDRKLPIPSIHEYLHKECIDLTDTLAVEEYGRQIKDASTKRKIERLAVSLALESKNGHSSEDILDKHIKQLMDIRIGTGRDLETIADAQDKVVARIKGMEDGDNPYWKFPLSACSDVLEYLKDDDFAIIAAETASGKSSITRFLALKTAMRGEGVLTFTLESTVADCVTWSWSMLTGINHKKVMFPKKLTPDEKEKILEARSTVSKLPWSIQEASAVTLERLSGMIRKAIVRSKTKIGLIIVDGMYLMGGDPDPYKRISANTQGLRSLVVETHIPIIGTTQYNRLSDAERKNPSYNKLTYAGEKQATIVAGIQLQELTPTQYASFPQNLVNGKLPTTDPRAVVVKLIVMKSSNDQTGPSRPILWDKATGIYSSVILENSDGKTEST